LTTELGSQATVNSGNDAFIEGDSAKLGTLAMQACPCSARSNYWVSQDKAIASMIGTVLAGRYELLELLGQGGMGVVYKAEHKQTGRFVAVKMLHEEAIADLTAHERFEQEARLISRLNHPHILRVYDFGRTEQGRPFIVTELLEGASLEFVIKEFGRLPVPLALRIFVQASAGLAHAHKQGVIHRDLKPSNLMLVNYHGEVGFVKIVDFGIAKLTLREDGNASEESKGKKIVGSPLYMSPEQCRGESLDARSDIYSLGCVIYRSLAGIPPVDGKDLSDLLKRQITESPPRFGDLGRKLKVPSQVESIVFKAMAKQKTDRYQSMDELRKDLLDFSERYKDDDQIDLSAMASESALTDPYENPIDHDREPAEKKPLEDTTEITEE
jgi:serine/threonine-protein kinase